MPIPEIPQGLANSMLAASVAFMVAVWLVVHLAVKRWRLSLMVAAGLGGWYGLVFVLGKADFFAQRPLFAPNMVFGFIAVYFWLRFLLARPSLASAFSAIPLHWVMSVQIFRVMGIGFLYLYWLGILPGEFALTTGWGDLAVGLSAPIVAILYFAKKAFSKSLAIVWNWIGVADLALALALGILTYSRPWQVIPTDVPNDPIALFPLVMVPLFAVPLSILLHLFTLRVLRAKA